MGDNKIKEYSLRFKYWVKIVFVVSLSSFIVFFM